MTAGIFISTSYSVGNSCTGTFYQKIFSTNWVAVYDSVTVIACAAALNEMQKMKRQNSIVFTPLVER